MVAYRLRIVSETRIVEIERIDEKGFGIARYGDRQIKIAYTLPGEKVKIRIPRYFKKPIRPLSIIEEAPERVRPLCPYFGMCGGCLWQHIRYDEQLKLKQDLIDRFFENITSKTAIHEILRAERIWRYRNKMEFSFGKGLQGIVLGLKVIGRFDKVVNLDTCLIQKEEGDKVLRVTREFARKKKFIPYDNKKHEGFLRFLVVRTSFNAKNVMANIVTTSEQTFPLREFSEKLNVTSLIWSVTDSLADVAIGDIKEIFGQNFIIEKLLGLEFKIYPYSFFQTNPIQAEKIFKIMKELSSEGTTALDLYSGVGVISLIIAEKFEKVIGIEFSKDAIDAAYENAKLNDINNVEFIEGKVEDHLAKFSNMKIDTVYIDPPRAGMHKRAVEALIKIQPRYIMYMSCNPKTQARDIGQLVKAGYKVELIQPIDFFPHTPHIENLVLLQK